MPEYKQTAMNGIRGIPWSYLFLFNLFLLSILVLSTRIATFLHEVFGHALPAFALGGDVNGIRISLFGGGNAYYRFETDLGPAGVFAVGFGGILVNLLTGAFAIALANKRERRRGWALFLSVFGIVSLLGGLVYACLGFYYGVGDPAASVRGFPGRSEWLWLPFLAATVFAAYYGVKSFFRIIQSWFRVNGWPRKVLVLAMTLGITGIIYTALYLATGQSSVALDTPSIARLRAEERIRQEKRSEYRRELRESHPEWTEQELARALEQIPVKVLPEEVPKKTPLIPYLILANLIGAFLALRVRETEPLSIPRISPRVTLCAITLSLAILAVLIASDGWILRAH